MGKRIGLAVVLAAVAAVVGYKAAGGRGELRLPGATREPAVVLVADAREADSRLWLRRDRPPGASQPML